MDVRLASLQVTQMAVQFICRLYGWWKEPSASFSHRLEAQRTEQSTPRLCLAASPTVVLTSLRSIYFRVVSSLSSYLPIMTSVAFPAP